jgi:hypothetical protein
MVRVPARRQRLWLQSKRTVTTRSLGHDVGAVGDQSLVLLKKIVGSAILLDDEDHMLNLRDVVGLGVGERCPEDGEAQ